MCGARRHPAPWNGNAPFRSRTLLGPQALNRALLARQLLLERGRRPVLEVVAPPVGMQAQIPADPYTGSVVPRRGFRPEELGGRSLDRRAVRIALQRSTIHLVTARGLPGVAAALEVVTGAS